MNDFAKLRGLTGTKAGGVPQILSQVAEELGSFKEKCNMSVHVICEGETGRWEVSTSKRGAKAENKQSAKPDVELITREKTLHSIADGSYSPIDAFLEGNLRVRGDTEMAKRILGHLCEPNGKTDVC